MSETFEISFEIVNTIDRGIYECYPIGKTYGYPIWIVCSFDFTSLKYEDLSGLVLRKIEGEEQQYVSNTNKGKSIFVIPKTVFMKLSEDDEDGSFGYYKASDNFTDNPSKPDLAKEMREKVKKDENTTTTPTKPTTRVKVAPQLLRNQRQSRDRSPEPKNNYGEKIREKLFEMIESYEPTQPMTSDFKKKKSLKKSLKKKSLKKSKKSLKKNKKSKNKSKTSIKCKKTPYAWKSSSIKKSPFRKLERAKDAETKYKAGQSIGFTAISSLKSLGRIPRSDGCYVLGTKYSALKRQ